MRRHSLGVAALLPVAALSVVALFVFQDARFFASGVAVALVDLRGLPAGWAVVVLAVVAGLTLVAVPVVPDATRPALLLGVSAAVLMRVLVQLTTAPLAGLVVAGTGIAVSLVVIGMAATAYGGRVVGASLLVGAGLDIAMMGGRHTLDLTRSTAVGATVVVVLLAILAIVAVWSEEQAGGQRRYGAAVPAAALFLVGPWLALHLLLTGNLGVIGTLAGVPLALATAAALAGAIGGLAWSSPARVGSVPGLAAVVCGAATVLAVRTEGPVVLALVALAGVAGGAMLTGSFERESTAPPGRAGWALAIGVLGSFLIAAAIESTTATPWGTPSNGWYLVLGLVLTVGGISANLHRAGDAASWFVPAIVSLALLAVPAWLWATDRHPEPEPVPAADAPAVPPAENPEIIVVSYNLSHGFDPKGRLGLEAMSGVLADTAWEILGVQEVSRGRLRDGGLDMVAWLEDATGVALHWQPSGSRFSGNALLARIGASTAEPALVGAHHGEAPTAIIDGSVLLEGVADPIRVFVVGMEAAGDGLAAALIDRWGGSPSTVVIGDFGPPGDGIDQVQAVLDAGFYDPTALVEGEAATYPSDAPTERRDVVLISRDLSLSAVRVVVSTASDHRPVVVRVLVIPPDPAE